MKEFAKPSLCALTSMWSFLFCPYAEVFAGMLGAPRLSVTDSNGMKHNYILLLSSKKQNKLSSSMIPLSHP